MFTVKESSTTEKINNFTESIENQLSSSSSSFLVGEHATAADVITCIFLGKASSRAGIELSAMPSKTSSLLTSILNKTAVTNVVGDLISKMSSLAISDENTSSELNDNPIIAKLLSLAIPHHAYMHPVCMTAEELVQNVPVPSNECHTKNLFFKDKKHGMFLVTCKTDASINTKALGKDLKLEGKTNLRFADEKTLWENLEVKPGCVGPMSIINDKDQKITLVIDQGLMEADKIHSHPLRNDASVVLTPQDLIKFVEDGSGHTPVMLEFGTKSENSEEKSNVQSNKSKPESKPKQQQQQQQKKKDKKGGKKGETLLAMKWKKEENFAMWYSDVIILSEMISYYDISGCYILRPWSYRIWELIQDWFNEKVGSVILYFCFTAIIHYILLIFITFNSLKINALFHIV